MADLEQETLSRELADLTARYEAAIAGEPIVMPWSPALPDDSRIARLRRSFSLTDFELAVILLAVARELAPRLDAPAVDWSKLDLGLALAMFDDADWRALSPDGTLRRLRLISLGPGEVLTTRPLHVAEPVLHALMGAATPDPRLARHLSLLRELAVPGSHTHTHAHAVASAWSQDQLACLTGRERDEARVVAASAAAELGLQARRIAAHTLPNNADELDELLQLLCRDVGLAPFVTVLELDPLASAATRRAFHRAVERVPVPAVAICDELPDAGGRTIAHLPVPRSTFEDRVLGWRRALADADLTLDGDDDLRRLAAQFLIPDRRIRAAVASVQAARAAPGSELETTVAEDLWTTCQVIARPRMRALARLIEPRATLDALVLPELHTRVLDSLAVQIHRRARVLHEFGFAGDDGRGPGVAAVFAGPSGTGKTMAAEALAHAARLDLYLVELGDLVHDDRGETELELTRLFDAAAASGAMLLFEQVDALFEAGDNSGRRPGAGYLLERLDAHPGGAIFTVDPHMAISDAILRRFCVVLDFPYPDMAMREELWRRMFPPEVPCEDLAHHKLSRLEISGGRIRDIVVTAAYLAADAGGPVTMQIMLDAAALEYAKHGEQLAEDHIRGWV